MADTFGVVGFLIPYNAVVDIERLVITQVAGATVPDFTSLVSNVDVLMTLFNGARGGRISDAQTDRVTVRGVNASLRRRDIRLKVITAPEDMSDLEGLYLRVDSSVPHPKGIPGLVPATTALNCSRFDMPKKV